MKSIGVKKVGKEWESVKHGTIWGKVNGWACSICGSIYEDRGDAQHCYNTHGTGHAYPNMPSVIKRKKPLTPIGKIDPAKLDQTLVNEWT